MIQISILGCGWLGFPLAKAFLKEGFFVKGSTTSQGKLEILKNSGIESFLISLSENGIEGNIAAFIKDTEILIIDVPPKLRGLEKENFVSKIKNVIPFIEKSSVKKLLFISSTSVYNDHDLIVTEETIAKPDSEGGAQLLQVEEILQNNSNFKTTIIRFAGLIGDDRNPARFLAGRKNIENPNAPINLVHQIDCIGIIIKIIQNNCWGEIFNVASPYHPTRKMYYTQKAIENNLILPEFDDVKPSIGKTILSNKLEKVLGYQFQIKIL
jgi:nucleoside-diphosphate-sugar epimerase